MNEYVVLVDSLDVELGVMEKMEAHEKGLLHRAFSVFVFNTDGQLLLQKRSKNKYHSGGLWTNTCCSHPRKGESIADAAKRRMHEEMGMNCDLQPAFSFIYQCHLDNRLQEHELDHVLIGQSNQNPQLNTDEAEDYKWANLNDLTNEINTNPELFTEWFKIALPKVIRHITNDKAI